MRKTKTVLICDLCNYDTENPADSWCKVTIEMYSSTDNTYRYIDICPQCVKSIKKELAD